MVGNTVLGQAQQALGGFMQKIAESGERAVLRYEKAKEALEDGKDLREMNEQELDPQLPETPSPQVAKGREIFQAGKERVEEHVPPEIMEATSPGDVNWWKKIALMGTASAVPIAATLLARSPTLSLGYAGAAASGTEHGEQREAGIPSGQAELSSTLVGSTEILTEFLPIKYLTDPISGKVLKTFVKYLAAEVPGELAQTTIQSANAKLTREPDMTWDQYMQDMLDTLGTTMVAAPALTGTASAIQRLGRRREEPPEEERFVPTEPTLPPATAEDWVNRAQFGNASAGLEGAQNPDLLPPSIDEPTVTLPSEAEQQLKVDFNAIEPETITEKERQEARRRVEDYKAAQKAPPLAAAEQAWSQISTAPSSAVEDIGELGASSRQAANAAGYINPNQGDRLDRVFTFGPQGFVGLSPRQALPKPGTYTLGVPSDDRPADYLRAVHDSVEQWRQQYIPNDTIVLSNEQLFSNSALGWHYHTDRNSHMIVPAVLRKPSRGLGQYNPNTQASAFYNATHEFGHALITSKFYEGVENMQAVRDESRAGLVTTLNVLPESQRAIAEEFNAIKARVLDGTMTAQEFLDAWMGPAKIGRANFLKDLNVSPKAKASDLVKAVARRGAANSTIQNEVPKRTLQRQLEQDYLSLDEYLAEQVSRYAYKRQWDQKSPIGKFFDNALRGLRGFFIDRKKDGIIAPGVAFQEWLDGLSRAPRVDEAKVTVENKKRAGKKRLPKGVVAPEDLMHAAEKRASKVKVPKVAHNVHTDTTRREVAKANKKIKFLEEAGTLNKNDSKRLRELVAARDWDGFVDEFQKIAAKKVSFEWDGEAVTSDPEWQPQKFRSPDFRAWFGEWESEPEAASVARIGVWKQADDGALTLNKAEAGAPLVLFTSKARLQAGENVFFAGTLKGAMHYESEHPRQTGKASMVPVVLNIRNPYTVTDLSQAAPNHQDLIAQGFDGIVYQNDFLGDVSFVVFRPEQVKVVPDRSPYPRDTGLHMEFDYDNARPEGAAAGRIFNGLKNFLGDQGPLRRALRSVTRGGAKYLLQMQQQAHNNPDLPDLQFMVTENAKYSRYGASRRALADDLVNTWERMGKENHARVNRFLINQYEGRERWFELYRDSKMRPGDNEPSRWYRLRVNEKTLQKAREHGIDPSTPKGAELLEFIRKVDESLLDYLNEDEKVLFELLAHRLGNSPAVLRDAVKELAAKVHELRQVPFLPQGRFGNYMLVVSKKRDQGPGYEVVYREAFETEAEWLEAWKRAAAKATPDMQVDKHILGDNEYVLMSLPKDFVSLMASELGLSDEEGPNGEMSQVERLIQLLQPVKQEKLLSQYEKDRLVKGYSKDIMRSYAQFSWHHSNAQAKLLYRRMFNLAITNIKQKLDEAQKSLDPQSPGVVQRLTPIHKSMEEMRDYVMAPQYEAQAVRAGVSVGYLAFNVKTALMNFFGLLTTYSDLSVTHGAIGAEKRFAEAQWRSMKSMDLTNLDARRKGNYLPPDIQWGLDRALEEGVLSQSYAYHLANAAGQRSLVRMPAQTALGRVGKMALDLGMAPFRLTELASRRIAFLAALQENLEKPGITRDEAYEAAVTKTSKLQNDFSLGNRVPIMRGNALGLGPIMPAVTIFGSFAQHMGFHGWGGYELGLRAEKRLQNREKGLPKEHDPKWYEWATGYTARLWIMLFAIAGYEGLPGAENLLDLIEMVYRRIGKKPLRQELREFVKSVDGDPVFMSRGLGANVFGFDVSRSIGLGRLFPGTDLMSRSSPEKPEEAVGSMAFDMAGPLGGFVRFGLQWYHSVSTKGFMEGNKAAARYAPGGVGNMINAYIWAQDGVKNALGAEITLDKDPETGKLRPRDLTAGEIQGKALGFNPEVVARNREIAWAQYDLKMYWQTRRQRHINDWVRARDEGDREAMADTKRVISEFNEAVAGEDWSKDFKIIPKNLSDAWKNHRKGVRQSEAGLPREKRYRRLYEDVRESFEPGESSP